MKKLGLILMMFFFYACSSSDAKIENQVEILSKIDTVLTNKQITSLLDSTLFRIAQVSNPPGFSVGIVVGDEIVYKNSFGVKNLKTKGAVTNETLFNTASISKTFTSAAIMQLVEQGKVDLDAPATKYLPYFTMKDLRYKSITIRQLLNHRSGLAHGRTNPWGTDRYDDKALEDKVKELQNKKLKFNPGEDFQYSNWGFCVLGDIIAKVSGKSFEDYMKENILNPLEMKTSTFLFTEIDSDKHVSPHVGSFLFFGWPTPFSHYTSGRSYAPKGGLWTNAEELCHWINAGLNKGEYKGKKILEPGSYDLMWQEYSKLEGNVFMGLGWYGFIKENGDKVLSYRGSSPGSQCTMYIDLNQKCGISILYNADKIDPNIFKSISAAMRKYLVNMTSAN